MNSRKKYSPFQFIGFIFAIVFEFLGFLLFFGLAGYWVYQQWFQNHIEVFIGFLLTGFIIGIFYMYQRAQKLNSVLIDHKKKEQPQNFFLKEEMKIKDQIENVKKEWNEYEIFLKKHIKPKKKDGNGNDEKYR